MRLLYALFFVCACVLSAASRGSFSQRKCIVAASTSIPPHLVLPSRLTRSSKWRCSAIQTFKSWSGS